MDGWTDTAINACMLECRQPACPEWMDRKARTDAYDEHTGDDDASDIGDAPAPKQSTKPAEVKKAAGTAAPAQKRFIPGQSKPKPAAAAAEPAAADAAAGFEGERGRDDRGVSEAQTRTRG